MISMLILQEEEVSFPLLECKRLTTHSWTNKYNFHGIDRLLRSIPYLENLTIHPKKVCMHVFNCTFISFSLILFFSFLCLFYLVRGNYVWYMVLFFRSLHWTFESILIPNLLSTIPFNGYVWAALRAALYNKYLSSWLLILHVHWSPTTSTATIS